jgi:ketosteroid isomerase-like protein
VDKFEQVTSRPAEGQNPMKELYAFSFAWLLLSISILACSSGPAPVTEELPSTEADVAAIKSMNQQCLDAINAEDVETVMSLTDDGVIGMVPNEPAFTGKSAYSSWLQRSFDQFNINESWSSEEIVVFGDWAFDRGYYTATITPEEGGDPVEQKGKYIYILKRQSDGTWRQARLIFNSDEPPPQ